MCKFFNSMIPDILDERTITKNATQKQDKIDNWNLCVQSARGAGCRLHDVKPENLAAANTKEIKKVMWQIVKLGLEMDVKMNEEYLVKIMPEIDPAKITDMPVMFPNR